MHSGRQRDYGQTVTAERSKRWAAVARAIAEQRTTSTSLHSLQQKLRFRFPRISIPLLRIYGTNLPEETVLV